MSLIRFLIALILALVLRQCMPASVQSFTVMMNTSASVPAPAPLDTALVERGIQVYRSQYCGTCHTLSAANTRGTFGPEHNGVATAAQERLADPNYTGSATTVDEYLHESIITPEIYSAPGFEGTSPRMPSYAHLPPEDIDAIVYMLMQQTGG